MKLSLKEFLTEKHKNVHGTKVVDRHGDPLVMFHGTKKKFDRFDPTSGTTPGSWFTSDRKAASEFGEPISVHLLIRNPASLRDLSTARILAVQAGYEAGSREFNVEVIELLQSQGFDGIHDSSFRGVGGAGGEVWAAFSYDQIKKIT